MKTLKTWTTAVHYDDEAETVTIMHPSLQIEHIPQEVVCELPTLLPRLVVDDTDPGEESELYTSGDISAMFNGYNWQFFHRDDDGIAFYCNDILLVYLSEVICDK